MRSLLLACFLTFCYVITSGQNTPQPTSDIQVVVANTEMNIMYSGYANRIAVGASGLTDSILVTCTGCTGISKSENPGVYHVRVGGGTEEVLIHVSDKKLSDSPVSTQKFRVLPFPRPRVYLSDTDPFAGSVEKSRLSGAKVAITLIGSPLDIPGSVTGGTVTVMVKGTSTSFSFTGDKLPELPIDYIETGAKIMIETRALLGGVPVVPSVVAYTLY